MSQDLVIRDAYLRTRRQRRLLASRVWPAVGAAAQLGPSVINGGNGIYGAYVELIAVNAIASDFYVLGLIGNTNQTGSIHRIQLAVGSAGAEVGIGFEERATDPNSNRFWATFERPPLVLANTRVAVRLAVMGAGTGVFFNYTGLNYALASDVG